jgi:hypothetical protein
MKKLVAVCAVVGAMGLGQAAMAQSSPFNGQWKADKDSMKYEGPISTVTKTAGGFTVVGMGPTAQKIICDGKPHPSNNKTMTSCVMSGGECALEVTKDGKMVRKATISISADGKTRSTKAQIFPPDASPYMVTSESKRVGSGTGMAGRWQETTFAASTDNGVLAIDVKGDMVAFKETDSVKPMDCKLDGTPTKFGDGGLMAVRLASPHVLKVTYKDSDGTLRRTNTFALSADGKTITETDITPAPGSSKMVLTLHKQ